MRLQKIPSFVSSRINNFESFFFPCVSGCVMAKDKKHSIGRSHKNIETLFHLLTSFFLLFEQQKKGLRRFYVNEMFSFSRRLPIFSLWALQQPPFSLSLSSDSEIFTTISLPSLQESGLDSEEHKQIGILFKLSET